MQTSNELKNKSSQHKSSTPQSKLLEIKREFTVPVAKLFNAFTNSKSLKVWWWPKDLYADHIEIDFREGGKYFINMKGYVKGGGGMTGKFEEIVVNSRIVMTDQFADETGRPISAKDAKMLGVWPELIYITFEFEPVNENASRFTLSQEGVPTEMQKDCIQGWSQSFDKLKEFLAS